MKKKQDILDKKELADANMLAFVLAIAATAFVVALVIKYVPKRPEPNETEANPIVTEVTEEVVDETTKEAETATEAVTEEITSEETEAENFVEEEPVWEEPEYEEEEEPEWEEPQPEDEGWNEMDWLYHCVAAEEGCVWTEHTYDRCFLCASCILNRAEEYGGIIGAITAQGQFEVYAIGTIYNDWVTETVIEACNDALENRNTEVYYFSYGNLHGDWAGVIAEFDGEFFYGR